ncbi:ligand-gated channel protein [Salinicola sp. JS01]|uniref:ligand-gated channel protein n=1 Tax=Salinicola sp. JS01 TaxID=3050071 RepID=UPI00255BBEE5|nr:ligand-gated channel protein [Salinicola sp. JS01]WIX32116.1 ligand-gated channel protein [Salinicola sp. JS01]
MPLSTPLRVSTLSLAVAAAGHAQAQESLDPLVVTAAGYVQQVATAPASISVITREQLADHRYRDITDALRSVPGVVITGGGAGDNGADISIRGMPPEYTLILVDGRRQSTRETRPNGSAGFEQDWLPPLQAIERIEVIRGPMSTLYGSDAIGGVINVITRKVADTWHGNLQVDATLQEDRDSGDEQQTQFYAAGPLQPGLLGLQVSGRYATREEDRIIDGYEEKALRSGTARLSLTPSANHDFTFEAGRTEQERRSRVGVSASDTGCRGPCTDTDDEFTREHFAITHTGRWGIGTSDSYVQREIAKNETREMEITNTVADSRLVMPFSAHILSVGANYEKQALEDASSNDLATGIDSVDVYQWALFIEDEWFLTDDFSLTGGVRLDDNENYGTHYSPRLYGVWSMTPDWTLKGGVSSGYRSPGLREITPGWGQVSRGGNVYGNPDLEPETSLNHELGLVYSGDGGMSASATLFYNEFEDKITRVGCPIDICTDGVNDFGADPTYRINVDEAITQGVELSLTTPLSETLSLTASYTFTDSEQKSGEYKGKPLTQLPRHLATATLDWNPRGRLSGWSRLTYRGEESQPTGGSSASTLQAPSYTLVDAGGSWEIAPQASFLFGIYNLLDKGVNYDDYGLTEDGRRYWVGINLAF